jgi:hypothetical protein
MDASARPSGQLFIGLHLATLVELPAWSAAPRGGPPTLARSLLAAGYSAVQGTSDPAFRDAGLATLGSGTIRAAEQAYEVIAAQADLGHEVTTLHVGTGFEDDADALRLFESVLDAARRTQHQVYVETHRATLTQDVWRTLRWAAHFPELKFNADLSHWYTGLQLPNGDFEEKLRLMAPIFAKTGFIHGRIGTSGMIQTSIGLGGRDEPHLGHFRTMWRRCFETFVRSSAPGDRFYFVPELLASVVNAPGGKIYKEYAPTIPDASGNPVEISDRWDQALKLVRIATDLFEAARRDLDGHNRVALPRGLG